MRAWLQQQLDRYRERRLLKAREHLQRLQARYQIFRALLDTNTRAVTLITELGLQLQGPLPAGDRFRARIGELLTITGEMVEKMARLDSERYHGLAPLHRRLAAEINQTLAELPTAEGLPLCLSLDEAGPELQPHIGGKAAKLAGLRRRDRYGVPAGFAVPVHACRLFLEQENLAFELFGSLRQGLATGGEIPPRLLAEARRHIMAAPLPPALEEALRQAGSPFFTGGTALAVRSSAIGEDSPEHSFAGQYATVLNVTTSEGLLAAFKTVVASSFTARSLTYRLHAGLDPLAFDMAVLCLEMVDARAAGILFTIDPSAPGRERMLISAVHGLGEQAVSGTAATDLYRVPRAGGEVEAVIATKEQRLVSRPEGGVAAEPVPAGSREQPALAPEQIELLRIWGLAVEQQEGMPQDIEWAIDLQGQCHLLQTRPLKQVSRQEASPLPGRPEETLLDGIPAAGGRATGRAFPVRSRQELAALPDGPLVLVLRQSLVDAARLLPKVHAVLVDFGNPADHLSCVAREYGVPMLTGLAHATAALETGQWLTVDAGAGKVLAASQEEIAAALREPPAAPRPQPPARQAGPLASLRERIITLNLTDAYGPTFSIAECRSLHDLVRFIHEKAVLTMFRTGDELLEETTSTVFTLEADIPFHLSIIDLGGGLAAGERKRRLGPEEIVSQPFLALWRGLADPALRWGPPPGDAAVGSVVSRFLTDHATERPIGMPNYLLLTRDYLNLNARMDFHFTMIDTVCGQDPRANHIKFRFKGGGTAPVQRRRRAAAIAEILTACDFFTDHTDDLVTADLKGVPQDVIEERLAVLGRLLGFTRLLDAAMRSDDTPHLVAQAFLEGDYGLERSSIFEV